MCVVLDAGRQNIDAETQNVVFLPGLSGVTGCLRQSKAVSSSPGAGSWKPLCFPQINALCLVHTSRIVKFNTCVPQKCPPTAFGFDLCISSVMLTGLCLHGCNAFLYWKVALVNGFLHQISKWKQITMGVLQKAGTWLRAAVLCSGCKLDSVAEGPAGFLM